jgi:hypothetical protein
MIRTCMNSFHIHRKRTDKLLCSIGVGGYFIWLWKQQANICRRSLKLLPDQLCLAFRDNISSMKRSTVQYFRHPFDRLYVFFSDDFFTVSKFANPFALSTNSSALVWRNNWLRKSPLSSSLSLPSSLPTSIGPSLTTSPSSLPTIAQKLSY